MKTTDADAIQAVVERGREIVACGVLHGHALDAMPVINPDGWFGKTWLVEIGGSYWPLFVIVEADTMSDAIEEFSESSYGHNIHVDDADLDDYPEDDRHYDGGGRVIDLDHVMIHGREGADVPFTVVYREKPDFRLVS